MMTSIDYHSIYHFCIRNEAILFTERARLSEASLVPHVIGADRDVLFTYCVYKAEVTVVFLRRGEGNIFEGFSRNLVDQVNGSPVSIGEMEENKEEDRSGAPLSKAAEEKKGLLGLAELELTHPVEADLFRIFSYYSLHGDASNPDYWRITMLTRFARDAQLLSSTFTSTQLELEVVKLGRKRRENQRKLMGETVHGRAFESNMTILISFSDFMSMLHVLALKVYPHEVSNDQAYRRLLLENVLLLSNRIIAKMENVLRDEDLANPAVWKIVNKDFNKSLGNIFKYYLHVADKRRSQLLAQEALNTGAVGVGNRQQNDTQKSITTKQRERLRAQKNLISSSEFLQFCQDYNLKSTSLLTSIQVGMAFFECTGYDPESTTVKGMTFDAFCQCIVYMALFAYRQAHHTVTAPNKVKALLLHMWRAAGALEKRAKAANAKGRSGHSHAGSLNTFGSGSFNDQFIKIWTAEGFINYSSPVVRESESGRSVVNRLIDTYSLHGGAPLSPKKGEAKKDVEGMGEEVMKKRASLAAVLLGGTSPVDEDEKVIAKDDTEEDGPSSSRAEEFQKKDILYGFQLSALFRTRPELAEMIYLEIEAMKEAENKR